VAYAAMGLLCLNFSTNTCFYPLSQLFEKPDFTVQLTNHINQTMKFNNAYLPLFFFCCALLYSPLAMWYAVERNENLSTVNPKVMQNLNNYRVGEVYCFPCTYTSFRFKAGQYDKGCAFDDSNIPFVFYKPDQCGTYRTK
jgi:hypothetical protein